MSIYITEHPKPSTYQAGLMPVAKMPAITTQKIASGGSSTQSAAFAATTYMVGIHTDAICSIEFGSNPTATTNSKRMAANTTEYFEVDPGLRVAVINNT